jgi:hypothetical protein
VRAIDNYAVVDGGLRAFASSKVSGSESGLLFASNSDVFRKRRQSPAEARDVRTGRRSTLGAQPISADLGTCGSKTRQPWQCKTWRYRDSPYGSGGLDLFIFFHEIKGVWYVNNWSVL